MSAASHPSPQSSPSRFSGIAIAGEHGSGKTTLADKLAAIIPDAVKMEISSSVIRPLLQLTHLPESYDALVTQVNHALETGPAASFDRNVGMALHDRVVERFGDDTMARLALSLAHLRHPGKRPLVSGVRSHAVASHLKQSGHLLVYLNAPKETLAQRAALRQGTTPEESVRMLEDEEKTYRTREIEPFSHLILSTLEHDAEAVARLVSLSFHGADETARL